MKVVITGGLGYLGTKLIEKLFDEYRDLEIIVFDNLMYDQGVLVYPILKMINRLYTEDVASWSDNLKKELSDADFLIPLAAIVGANAVDKNVEDSAEINQHWFSDLNVFIESENLDLKIIYPNTSSGYGNADSGRCDERTLPRPISAYGLQKQAAEEILMDGNKRKNTVSFRLGTVFGWSWRPRMDLLVNDLTHCAFEKNHISVFGGDTNRNYIHINDICSAFILAMDEWNTMKGEIYNLGNESANCKKIELVKLICEVTGATYDEKSDKSDPDKRDFILDTCKLRDTGWAANVSLKEGVKEMSDFYKFAAPDGYLQMFMRNF